MAHEIKKWRTERGLTQGELAKIAGVTRRTIARWEIKGSKANPKLKLVLDSYDEDENGEWYRHPWDALYLPELPPEDLL